MPLSVVQLRTKTHHALALGHRHHRHPPSRPLHGLSLRYGGAIDGRIAALADSGQRTLVRVRLRSLYQVLCEHAQRVCLYRFQTSATLC